MMGKFKIKVSDERALTIYKDIAQGSEPELRFYVLVAASTAIAVFGLIQDSTAVVIGAMLVAPLMTPIFGIALALVRGHASLLGRAIRAEIAGVILTVSLGAGCGWVFPELQVTPEMLSRTSPTLLDLLVAIFAGLAGAYAMVDEHLSPALPGVAISTAIVPPLANSGLCLALGAYNGAMGSFLLFFANFLSILLVASALFIVSGMAREFEAMTKKDVLRRFGLATIGFLIVTAILSRALYVMVEERHLASSIHTVLQEEFSHLTAKELRKVIHYKEEDKTYVLAHVHASSDIQPSQVKKMESALEQELETPVELFVRSTHSRDVSATGSTNQVLTETLDGFFVSPNPDPRIKLMKQSEQAIREYMETQLGLYVEAINLIPLNGRPLILATILGARNLGTEEIEDLELDIRTRTGNNTVNLIIRHIPLELYDRLGKYYYEWASLENFSREQEKVFKSISNFLHAEFDHSEYFLDHINITIRQGVFHVMVELSGRNLYSQAELVALRNKLLTIAENPVQVYVRSKPEVVLTQRGDSSFTKLQEKFLKDLDALYPGKMRKILEETL